MIEVLTLDSEHENYEASFQLDGETFGLRARYNNRVDSWFLTLIDADGSIIVGSRRVTVGNLLFPWLVGRNRPAGQLLAIDTEDEDGDPGRHDLGSRVLVMYADADELEAAGARGA